MNEHENQPGGETPAEVSADFGLQEPAPSWPMVVGIISIVWASIGLLCGVAGGLWGIFGPRLMGSGAEGGSLPPTAQLNSVQWGLLGLGFGVALLLLVAGIATTSRKASGRPMHLAYAVLGLLLALANLFVQIQLMDEMARWVQDNPDSPFAQNYSDIGQKIGLAVGLAMGAAWPLFCVVWFGVLNKRPEENAPEITA